MIEKQVFLQEENQNLMKKVKVAKKKIENSDYENRTKTIEPAFGGGSSGLGGGRPPSSSQKELRGANGLTAAQESQLKILKEQLFNQNK